MRRLAGLAREALLLEIALYGCLVRWLVRRPDVPGGSEAVGYGRLAVPMIGLFAFVSAIEVPVVHVLVPWQALRLPLLVVGVWGVLWMLGLMAAYRVRPHLLTEQLLRVRNSGRTEIVVPLASVAEAAPRELDAPGTVRSVHVVGTTVLVGVSGRTNLHLTLRGPTRLATPRGEVDTEHVRLWVDEPREVAARLRELTDRRSAPRS